MKTFAVIFLALAFMLTGCGSDSTKSNEDLWYEATDKAGWVTDARAYAASQEFCDSTDDEIRFVLKLALSGEAGIESQTNFDKNSIDVDEAIDAYIEATRNYSCKD